MRKENKQADQALGRKGRRGQPFRFAFFEARELLHYFFIFFAVTAIIFLDYIYLYLIYI
jgi:hypothetical protein